MLFKKKKKNLNDYTNFTHAQLCIWLIHLPILLINLRFSPFKLNFLVKVGLTITVIFYKLRKYNNIWKCFQLLL